MLVTNTAVGEKSHSFERPIIFIPKWLDKRLVAFSKTSKTLKDIDGLFSILTPADVSFYLDQVSAVSRHPAALPYFQSFNVFSYMDSTSWGTNISAQKAAKKYNKLMDIMIRAKQADIEHNYVKQSYVENNTPVVDYDAPTPINDQHRNDIAQLAGILGADQNDTSIDFNNLRVILDDLDADTLIMRLELNDPDQNRISQTLVQTEANIKKITQYYEFSKVMASPIGKYYSRLVLTSPST